METPYTSAAVTGPINLEMLRTAMSNVVELHDALLWAKPLISEIDDYVNLGERLLEETSLLFLKGSALAPGTSIDAESANGSLHQLAKAYAAAVSSYIELRDAVYRLAIATADTGNRDGAAKLFGGLMAVELDWRDVRQRLVTPYLSEAIQEGRGSRWSEAREALAKLRCHYRSSGEDWHQDVLTPLINRARAHWQDRGSISEVLNAVLWVEFAIECQFFEPRSTALIHLLERLEASVGESANSHWWELVEESYIDSIRFKY